MRSLLTALACASVVYGAITEDEVNSLPGWTGSLPTKTYSGYLQVRDSGASLHYMFFESEATGPDVPVVLWLNGGPGCSSMDGAFYENGPFTIENNQLSLRPTRWTKKAHMLYLESPVGVGFSYSPSPADYSMNDTTTADDNLRALVQFFKGFPEYAANDFFISGESYAGVYIPTLAYANMQAQSRGDPAVAGLKGIMVGNGCTGTEVGTCSPFGDEYRFEYMGAHNLFPASALAKINASCAGQWANPSNYCTAAINEASDVIGRINIYNIGANECQGGAPMAKLRIHSPLLDALQRAADKQVSTPGPVACIDAAALSAWVNQPAVTDALHVSGTQKYWQQWQICSNSIFYNSTARNLPRDVYPSLVQNYRVLIFNGDYDACVPIIDNELWTEGAAAAQGWPVQKPWHAWMSPENQVAGYATEYSTPGKGSFTFTTIHGAGHMVPQFQPEFGYQMMSTFLDGNSF